MAVNLDRLLAEANRAGRRGKEAVAVLQDALMEAYPRQFETAIEAARAQAGPSVGPYVVVYSPHHVAGSFGTVVRQSRPSLLSFLGPFVVAYEPSLWRYPMKGETIVWSAAKRFNVDAEQTRWRAADRGLRAELRARPTVTLDVERVRLDSGGYDRRGRYFGSGAPLFLVTSREPLLPADYYPINLRLGYISNPNLFWVHAEVRAPDARTARREVAEQLGVNARSRG